jgi:hypothetical protein
MAVGPSRHASTASVRAGTSRLAALADEFPTLEVVLAACVLGLAWRGVSLLRAASSIEPAIEAWERAIRAGDAASSASLERNASTPWLAPLAHSALVERENAAADPALHPVAQRGARLARGLKSAAARDLVVCAVLAGSLAYAWVSRLVVSPIFFVLGVTAAVLLLGSVLLRIRLADSLKRAGLRFSRAAASAPHPKDSAGLDAEKCSRCGSTRVVRVTSPEELGPRLGALHVEEIVLCASCGRIEGRAAPAPPPQA